ncbi:DegT/DnrJ/EryC1/StrS family aminotransferase [Aliiroseovarius sp. S1339]|uniref:DegT/DnrJ/EryC1/StrS family aminotransferase n=1 Tax=Aliiroseovarius sp. S1339 TaxID=2936990 RepID=UPI0020C1529F|nr:DegT/DnrJ/EryC1/StrS family aminotransferase [Aliiroseovarius sp. S1339]MCK8464477.1 DegT/DnrJ/EryC1/StrS family aminotransferase [Aliiroseovarius sp. S1339]
MADDLLDPAAFKLQHHPSRDLTLKLIKRALNLVSAGPKNTASEADPSGYADYLMHDRAEGFRAAPVLDVDQPGFEHVLRLMEGNERFAFCKINHGFWERLAKLERLGVARDKILTTSGKTLDEMLGIGGSMFAEGGMLAELLGFMRDAARPDDGMHFVASLVPWPASDRIEGTPYENRAVCEALIEHFVPDVHCENVVEKGFSGHEFKVAAITGSLHKFTDALRDRDVIFIGNDSNRALIDALGLASLTTIIVDAGQARLERENILEQLCSALEAHQNTARLPLVIGAAGGSLTTWLAFKAWEKFARFQFVDLGGTLAAFSPETAMRSNWTSVYQRQLAAALPKLNTPLLGVENSYTRRYGLRDPKLVELATAADVPEPASNDELSAPFSQGPIQFIENKIYDHQRMAELLSLSIAANHHANGGPVAALLESMVAALTNVPAHRRVIAVNNGTSALHLACGLHELQAQSPGFRWVASAFNFFSCKVGPLSETQIIDCDAQGRFDLDALKALPLSSYDGVIYTNVFATQSDWDDVADFCSRHGKSFVVDNATGLFDRPASSGEKHAPIETISAHHTKPWGVGEGGFILCDADQDETIRALVNYAARLPDSANFCASNFKLSDLSAAAIIDRLERMPYWRQFYKFQERRMKSLVIDTGLDIRPFAGDVETISPLAHTAFLAPVPVDIDAASGPVIMRKYYRPLVPKDLSATPIPNAQHLFDHVFSLSNAPEMRLASNEDIIAQIIAMVRAGEKTAADGSR